VSALPFQHYADRNPDSLAVVGPNGEQWSRSQFAALMNGTANALRSSGVRPGEVIAIVSPNCAEYLAVYLAGVCAGLRIVPINWHLARDELAFVLRDSAAAVVVAHERLGHRRLAQLREDAGTARLHIAIGRAPGYASLYTLAAGASRAPVETAELGRVMPYTSATTGRPKAVCLPLGNAREALAKTIAWHASLGIEPEDDNVHLCTSMLYHSAPLEGAFIALQMGHAIVLADRPDPRTLLELIERYEVTTTFLVPSMFVRLVKLDPRIRRGYATKSLRFVVHGGAPCPIETKRTMIDWWGPIVWEAYGAAEAQGTIVSASDWLERPGTVGQPIPGSALKILDDDGRELPPGSEGMVYIKPHTSDRFHYHNAPEQTAKCWRGELVTVGDVGTLDDDGFLFLCDRRTDLILSSGMNVYPAEIEHALVEHPSVVDCGVIGIPHELFGEVPKAFVQASSSAAPGPALAAELLAYLCERLSPMKLPRRIEFVDTLPRDPNGKLHRRRLRSLDRERVAEEQTS
jgi:long-chain acyl-CoA synthetase